MSDSDARSLVSLRNAVGVPDRTNRRIAAELSTLTAALVGLSLWQRAVSAAFASSPPFGGVLVGGLVAGGVFVAGVAAFAGAYASVRGIGPGVRLPSRRDLPLAAAAVAVPVALVALTELVGTVTGVPYNSLTKTSVAADASLTPVVLVTAVGAVAAVPALVIVCHVLVQGSLARAVDDGTAVVLTTLVAGFVLVGGTGGLVPVPDTGKLVGAVLFTLLVGVGVFAADRVERERVKFLAYVPLLSFGAVVLLSGVAGIGSVAGGMFAGTRLAVLGVAAYTYDRTDSLLVPALAYTSLLAADRAVVVVLEAGMHSW
ncbi:hypothetical protein [Halobaculum magnesiiphilum]|uniref:Uncharacterized protein n=1 Tax=Halobaculum magnesiiphilum TaxID=1017351 RepID=A0A8T8WC33_9EURY|nr:hypothetical protein [Halobaculum magnesiiphilum]QZP37294.1 hypothetical protein K6T50_13560 [Halobaculum magnesiiphilum]